MKSNIIPEEIATAAKELVFRFDYAWNGRDAESLVGLFTEAADFQFHYGLLVRGRERIKKYYRDKVFPYLEKRLRHATRKYKLRMINESTLIGDGRVDLVLVDQDGKEIEIQRRLKVTTVVVKTQTGWKFAAVRVMQPVKEA